ncbi:YqaJ viral recombinase family protein [Staphylococcus epidermidis]|nr:YqaJ viral recombinase family protein [Staphylococcus epidermidis]
MIIHDVKQGTPEWHALRANHDTASEASAMMGFSRNTSRTELLRLKATGSEKEFSDWTQKHLLDKGHAIEALALAIAEKILGEELYPCTGTSEEFPRLLASFDGINMAETVIWENKSWNEAKAEEVRGGVVPLEDQFQVVQQLVVSRAERCLYMVTDGTEENTVHLFVTLDPADEQKLHRGWQQFNEDRANYAPAEVKPQVIAAPVAGLPPINYKLNGLALTSNLAAFRAAAEKAVEESKRELATDQDFADREALCKRFGEAEEKIKLVREQVIGEIKDVDTFCRELGEIGEMIRQARLAGEKQVSARKEQIKLEIRNKAEKALTDHILAINTCLAVVTLPQIVANFAGAMKSKRTIATLQDAVDTELARAKIQANELAEMIEANLVTVQQRAPNHQFLFADLQQLVLKAPEDLLAVIDNRLVEHERQQREKAEREAAANQAQAPQVAASAAVPPAANQAQPARGQRFRAVVFDKSALIQAIADGHATEDLLMVDQAALDSLMNDPNQPRLPGVRAEKVPAAA